MDKNDQIIKIIERYSDVDTDIDFSYCDSNDTINYLDHIKTSVKSKKNLMKCCSHVSQDMV